MNRPIRTFVINTLAALVIVSSCSPKAVSPKRAVADEQPDGGTFTEKTVPVVTKVAPDGTVTLRFYDNLPDVAYISAADFQSIVLPGSTMTVTHTGAGEYTLVNGKAKAGLCFQDIEEAVFHIEENNNLHYSIHLNSANDLLIKPSEKAEALSPDARKRRLASEKSMSVLTSGDVKSALSGKVEGSKPYKKRTEKKRMNINKNYDDWE